MIFVHLYTFPGVSMSTRSLAIAVAVALSGQLAAGTLAAHAAGGDITTACQGTLARARFTLSANCDTTVTLTVPNGLTVIGAGHEITAHDPNPAAGPSGLFDGPVVTNAGTTMNLRNLTVRGTGFTSFGCNAGATPTVGLLYNNASGAITDVKVLDITQHSTCQTVHSVQLRADAGPQTVNVTGSTVSIFQRTALLVQGDVTVHASGNTFGPPDPLTPNPGGVAQNTVQIGSPALAAPSSGSLTGNTIIGSSYGRPAAASTGLLLAGAAHLQVSHNTFSGHGTDIGVSFFGRNTDITIAYNKIDRSAEDRPGFEDSYGYGVNVTDESRPYTTLICNTFAGWKHNLRNTTQAPCITTAADLPCVTVDEPVVLHLDAHVAAGRPDLTWRLATGALPDGLTLHHDGSITGTPTETGTTAATIEVTDPTEGSSSREFVFCVQPAPTPTPQPTTPTPTHNPTPTHRPGPVRSAPPTGTELAKSGGGASRWLLGVSSALLAGGLLLAGVTRRGRRR
ncbi:right-handed parallel beta-helix repeat-containing protein [Streptacidiphilus sp. EB103A]|uniref:right-handed parallel beta-helix repeat-containing protein n=1 Tax=Streptacidiphilus sp. EB103A TaxID=3156275 RepID=UPI003511F823